MSRGSGPPSPDAAAPRPRPVDRLGVAVQIEIVDRDKSIVEAVIRPLDVGAFAEALSVDDPELGKGTDTLGEAIQGAFSQALNELARQLGVRAGSAPPSPSD